MYSNEFSAMHQIVSSPVHSERFEIEQFVRVQLGNNRVEIGVVTGTDDVKNTITVTTRHGYDITINASAVKRAFLIVLDLNGVLVARGKGSFTHRPYVEEFIKFVFKNFVVAVWTSGLERSSNPIIESVFGAYRDRLLFTLYRDACTNHPTINNPYGTVKNLQRIFDKYPKSFHSVNTIIIDDSPGKCSHPDIALCPVPFNNPTAQINDNGLLQAISVLEEVLLMNSHIPLIEAAEKRLSELSTLNCPANSTIMSEKAKDSEERKSNIIIKNKDSIANNLSNEHCNNSNRNISNNSDSSSDRGDVCGNNSSNNKAKYIDNNNKIVASLREEQTLPVEKTSQIPHNKAKDEDDIFAEQEEKNKTLVNITSTMIDQDNSKQKSNSQKLICNEVNLWNTRLCCEYIRGCCRYGEKCRYRHERDDGKQPCYRKHHCRFGHASRWVITDGDTVLEQEREKRLQDGRNKRWKNSELSYNMRIANEYHTLNTNDINYNNHNNNVQYTYLKDYSENLSNEHNSVATSSKNELEDYNKISIARYHVNDDSNDDINNRKNNDDSRNNNRNSSELFMSTSSINNDMTKKHSYQHGATVQNVEHYKEPTSLSSLQMLLNANHSFQNNKTNLTSSFHKEYEPGGKREELQNIDNKK